MGVMEKIKEIEAEMARTQKNKATNVSAPGRDMFVALLVVSRPENIVQYFLLLSNIVSLGYAQSKTSSTS